MPFDQDLMTKADKIKHLAYQMQNMVNQVEAGGGPTTPVDNLPEFEEIPSLFRPFASLPNFTALESTRNRMHQDIAMLLNNDYGAPQGYTGIPVYQNSELSAIKTIRDQMSHWLGAAARHFEANYVDKFDDFTQNLFVATFVAAEAVGAEAKLWETTHNDIHGIANAAITALESMPGKSGATGFKMVVTVLPSVVSIAEAAAKGVKDVALTAVKELAGKGEQTAAASGSFKLPRYLIYDMKKSIQTLNTNVKGMETAITNALNSNAGYLKGHASLFVAPTVNNGAWDLADSDDHNQPGDTTLGEDDRG